MQRVSGKGFFRVFHQKLTYDFLGPDDIHFLNFVVTIYTK